MVTDVEQKDQDEESPHCVRVMLFCPVESGDASIDGPGLALPCGGREHSVSVSFHVNRSPQWRGVEW